LTTRCASKSVTLAGNERDVGLAIGLILGMGPFPFSPSWGL
jgi:hypothetical protein